MHEKIVVVHGIAVFSAALDGATADRQILNCTFTLFCSNLRKDGFANYRSIWTQFPPPARELDVLYNVLKVSQLQSIL